MFFVKLVLQERGNAPQTYPLEDQKLYEGPQTIEPISQQNEANFSSFSLNLTSLFAAFNVRR